MGKLPFRQVHLDFHTSEQIEHIGRRFDKKQFQETLKLGHVNSVTVFSKCHHGWAYHPTEAGETHPHLDFDLLGQMIEACKEIGVQTPVYISVGLDEKLARVHPEWLLRNKDESIGWAPNFMAPGFHNFCLNSPYLEVVIKQCEEAARRFDCEGLFLDIVSPRVCYCQNCVKTVRDRGLDPLDDRNFQELAEEVYQNYYIRVGEAVRAVKPEMRIFHNGGHIARGRRDLAFANTHLEVESLPTGGWGYDHFPLSARYIQGLGIEFLGMTGKFHTSWGEFGGFKHPNALRYETALSIANGAKCSIGDQMHPEGFLDPATYALIGAAYGEVEAKEAWCDDAESVADIAVLSAEAAGAPDAGRIDAGVSRMVLEGKYLYDVVDTESDFSQYKAVILPDRIPMAPALKQKLDAFTAAGGQLLATGESGLDEGKTAFAYDFGAVYKGRDPLGPSYFHPDFQPGALEPSAFVFYGDGHTIDLAEGGAQLAARIDPYFNRDVFHFCSHQHTPPDYDKTSPGMTRGKNGVYIAWTVFADYAEKGSLILKEAVRYALDTMLGDRITLKTNLGAQGVVTLMRQREHSRYVNHLLYASPVKRGNGIEIIEDLLPVYNTEVILKLPEKIKRVYLAPENRDLTFTQDEGKIKITVDKFTCHIMIVLDY